MIITQTPFRMSFFGGGTDVEEFFREYGGAVISTTFDKYCYVTVRHLPRFFDYKSDITYSKTEKVNSYDEIEHPAIRNAILNATGVEVDSLPMNPHVLYRRFCQEGLIADPWTKEG